MSEVIAFHSAQKQHGSLAATYVLLKKHPDQKLWINRRAPRVAVEICQMSPDAAQIEVTINRPQQVVLRYVVFQRELVEQSRLGTLKRDCSFESSEGLVVQSRIDTTSVDYDVA